MFNRKYDTVKFNRLVVAILVILILISMIFNKMILTEALLVGGIFIWYIYIRESRLMIFTVLGILFTPTLSGFSGSLSNLPYLIIALLCIKLLEKKIILKEEIVFDKIIILLSLMVFLINIFSLIYNQYKVGILLILFYSLKKFSFLILYLFFLNTNITKKDIKNNLNIIIIFGIIQFGSVVIQFLGGTRQDALGGMFGSFATGIMIQYLTIILILITALEDKFSKIPFLDLIVVFFSLIYSAMGEVKVGFIIIPVLYLLQLLLKGKKVKIIITGFLLFFSFSVIYAAFLNLYPNQDFLSSLTSSESYLESAYGTKQVNRTGFLALLKDTVLDTPEKQLFGTGLATINPSKTQNLQGPLVEEYGYLNIHFFALPYSVTENGIIGTFIWLMIYVYIISINIKEYLVDKNEKSIVNIMLIIDTFIFIVYNNSIFTSFSIILILWFVIPFFSNEKVTLV